MKRFDQWDNDYLQDLNTLRSIDIVDEFKVEFQRLAVMIHHIYEEWLTFLFIKSLSKPLYNMVKVLNHRAMDDVIRATYDLEPIMKSRRGGLANKAPPN